MALDHWYRAEWTVPVGILVYTNARHFTVDLARDIGQVWFATIE